MDDLPAYLKNLPLHEQPEVSELILKVLLLCKEKGITTLSVGSLLIMLGVADDKITDDMWNDGVELSSEGLNIAIAIKEKDSHVIH